MFPCVFHLGEVFIARAKCCLRNLFSWENVCGGSRQWIIWMLLTLHSARGFVSFVLLRVPFPFARNGGAFYKKPQSNWEQVPYVWAQPRFATDDNDTDTRRFPPLQPGQHSFARKVITRLDSKLLATCQPTTRLTRSDHMKDSVCDATQRADARLTDARRQVLSGKRNFFFVPPLTKSQFSCSPTQTFILAMCRAFSQNHSLFVTCNFSSISTFSLTLRAGLSKDETISLTTEKNPGICCQKISSYGTAFQ